MPTLAPLAELPPQVRVLDLALPGSASCAVTVRDGVLWILVDWRKPLPIRHLLALLAEVTTWAFTGFALTGADPGLLGLVG